MNCEAMSDHLDVELVARSINFHGQPLQKSWESERGEGDLQKLKVDADFSVYSQRHLNFQDRGKRLKLNQFIAKKANLLFDPEFNEREERPPIKSNDAGLFAVLPPYDLFLGLDKSSRVKHFFQCVKVGDVVFGSILSKITSGLIIKLLWLDGASPRYVADLNIKVHCYSLNLISAVDKKNISRQFLINDLVCCEVLEVIAETEKMSCGMKGVYTSNQRVRLGLVHSDDFPENYSEWNTLFGNQLLTTCEKHYKELIDNNRLRAK